MAAFLLERMVLALSHQRWRKGDSMNDRSAGCTSPFSLLFYFVAGGLAGAGVALLLAPQSGKATRDTMRRRLSSTAGSARHLRDDLIRRGREARHEAGHRIDDAVSALAGDGGAKRPG